MQWKGKGWGIFSFRVEGDWVVWMCAPHLLLEVEVVVGPDHEAEGALGDEHGDDTLVGVQALLLSLEAVVGVQVAIAAVLAQARAEHERGVRELERGIQLTVNLGDLLCVGGQQALAGQGREVQAQLVQRQHGLELRLDRLERVLVRANDARERAGHCDLRRAVQVEQQFLE